MSASNHTAPPTAKQFVLAAAACLPALILAIVLVSVGVDRVRGVNSATASRATTTMTTTTETYATHSAQRETPRPSVATATTTR